MTTVPKGADMTTFSTPDQYAAFLDARAAEIRERIENAVAEAAREVFESEATGSKYVDTSDPAAVKIGFRDGIGFEIRVVEAYRPEVEA
jgi:hypothetical protein